MKAWIEVESLGYCEAIINVADWSASVDIGDVDLVYEYGSYKFLHWLDGAEVEANGCTCEITALWNVGCRCGAVTPYRVPR